MWHIEGYHWKNVRYQWSRSWYLNQERDVDAGAFGGSRCIQRYMLFVTKSSGKAATEIAGGEDRERRRKRRTRSRRRRRRRKLAVAIAAAASKCGGTGYYFWERKIIWLQAIHKWAYITYMTHGISGRIWSDR